MDSRLEQRKKDFKKTFEDSRRKREEQQLQIRKSQREERFSKRRQQVAGLDNAAVPSAGGGPLKLGPSSAEEVASGINAALSRLHSTDAAAVAQGALELRRLLSVPNNPPIAEVINAGAVPRLVELMGDASVAPAVAFDAAWSLTNIASGDHTQTEAVVNANAIAVFARLLRSSESSEVREQSAWALGNIAGDCPALRDKVLSYNVLQPMIDELRNAMGDQLKRSVLVNCCWALSNFCRGRPKPSFDVISACIPVLKDIIFTFDVVHDVLADACWALSYVTDGNDDRSFAAVDAVLASGVAPRLVQLMSATVSQIQTPALRVVGNIVSGTEMQTQAMLNAQCVPVLKQLLSHSRKLIRKEACWTVSNITAGTQAQIGAILKEEIIQDILAILPTCDMEVRAEAWWAIANAASGASPAQVRELMDMGCMRELAAMLDCEQAERKLHCVVLEGLENIFAVGNENLINGNNPYVLLLEEVGGFTALEKMQYLPVTEKSRELAVNLIRKYMQYDEDPGFDYAAADNADSKKDNLDFSNFQMQ